MTRYVTSPGSSVGKGSCSGAYTPVAETSVTIAVERSFSNGVNGTQRRAMLSIGFAVPACPQLQLPQHLQQLRVLRSLADVVHVDVANDALFVDEDDRARAMALLVDVHAVVLGDF